MDGKRRLSHPTAHSADRNDTVWVSEGCRLDSSSFSARIRLSFQHMERAALHFILLDVISRGLNDKPGPVSGAHMLGNMCGGPNALTGFVGVSGKSARVHQPRLLDVCVSAMPREQMLLAGGGKQTGVCSMMM